MRGDRVSRVLSIVALSVAVLAAAMAGRALWLQRDHTRQMETLGELIERSTLSNRPVMDMGPPGGGRPEPDRGE